MQTFDSHATEARTGPLGLAFTELITADAHAAVTPEILERIQQLAYETATAAFVDGTEESLDDAHRSLFRMYAAVIWGSQSFTPKAAIAIHGARSILENAFRDNLTTRCESTYRRVDSAAVDNATWFLDILESLTSPPGWRKFIREQATLDDLKSMISHRSLFFLREPDPWIFAVPALTGEAKAGLIDLLLDEYGWGKYDRMHSTVYRGLMDELKLETELDHYFDATPWQYIATLNLQWMYALVPGRRRRLIGAIFLTEAESPDAMNNYLAAWRRLGVDSHRITNFFELHVTADEDHRRVALEEIVLPLCVNKPDAIADITAGMLELHLLEHDYLANFLASDRLRQLRLVHS